ncbi:MAG: NAD(P)-dependent oxidoreductase [Pseudomonadota bacterium]
MQLFIYEPAYRRIQEQIHAICPHVRPILMMPDSRILQDGGELSPEEVRPDAAWISTDVFFSPAARDFLLTLIKGPPVKWLQSAAAGFDNPIFQTLAKKAEIYTNSNGAAKGIAEFVFAGVIDFFHPNVARRKLQAAHEWKRLAFRDIAATNWMVIGYGNIGQEVGRRAMAFEAHVTGVRRNPGGAEPASAMLRPDAVLAALPRMDVVVLTADSNDSNRHLVNAPFLAAMKPGSVLVNIARGALIDEAALLDSLAQGVPECAILDVFETEPLPADSPFWDHPRVRLTAHCAAASPMMEPRGDNVFLRNLAHFTANEPLELRVRFN